MAIRLDNPARHRLEAGELSLGVGIIQGRTVDIAPMMHTCGFDWLFIDLEHGAMTLDAAAQISMTALASGISPIVRMPIGDYGLASRMLDGGALGIVQPHVETADDARRMVDALRFPPIGHRGVGGVFTQLRYEPVSIADGVEVLNRSTLLTVMLETPEAIGRADEIAAVDGIDVVMIGTNDLALAYNHPGEYGHADVVAAYATVAEACRKHGKWLGSGGVREPEMVRQYIHMGVRFLLAGQDAGFMMAAARERATFLRATDLSG